MATYIMLLIHFILRIHQPKIHKYNELLLESTPDRERYFRYSRLYILDILEELQNNEPYINNIRTSGINDERLQGHFWSLI